MPHLRIEYTGNLDGHVDMQALCNVLCRTLTQFQDETGNSVFPLTGTRVLAYPAPYAAVADGADDRAFLYLLLRIAPGRPQPLLDAVGKALLAQVDCALAPVTALRSIRATLQFDEGRPVYEGKWASA
ncbi:5-carboxymethyl-2-hydroxymuconate isomerase [Pseudoduganella umbonata]|uniref:5-carboxymethyl-2-hydroxymuconate isomerase n=1 Tax=Pseudoduganella umbonata TaxID=864828 RepID=A0A4P8HTX6_9BURK|nr:5-carboxymethyl-2-hydroxymuconate isomerase [Pseudoduganella umbonata]MBB3220507.1 5-carboxymethyl-2-hydroxymuconate isomerase [Pseudoduganella umbonata]QCP11974.1 5-carboxymethyl-2-hydroxymuconate isomerase [Pseudoduganella umbonata]